MCVSTINPKIEAAFDIELNAGGFPSSIQYKPVVNFAWAEASLKFIRYVCMKIHEDRNIDSKNVLQLHVNYRLTAILYKAKVKYLLCVS